MSSISKLSRAEKPKRAEQERIKAEQEKTKAGQEKIKAEQKKIKAEQEKIKAEQEKIKAEQKKIKAEQEKKKPEIKDFFESEMLYSHDKWQIRDDEGWLRANCCNLQNIIKQPRLNNIKHILVLGLSYPEQIAHDRRVDNKEQKLFFRRLAVVHRLRETLFPKGGPVEIENANLKSSQETILGLNHLEMTMVNGRYGGFSLANDHSLVYDLRRKEGDLIKHILDDKFQLPAAVVTDMPSLRPSSDVFSKVLEKYDLVSLMGVLKHVPCPSEEDLRKKGIPFVRVRGAHPVKAAVEMAEMESKLTIKAYTDARKRHEEADTYTSEPEMILLIRKGLPYFNGRDVPTFPLALYHNDDPVKLTPSDFD